MVRKKNLHPGRKFDKDFYSIFNLSPNIYVLYISEYLRSRARVIYSASPRLVLLLLVGNYFFFFFFFTATEFVLHYLFIIAMRYAAPQTAGRDSNPERAV